MSQQENTSTDSFHYQTVVEDTAVRVIKMPKHATAKISSALQLPQRPRIKPEGQWMLGLSFILLLLFTIVRSRFSEFITQNFLIASKLSYTNRIYREQAKYLPVANIILDIIFFLCFSFFLYLVIRNRLPIEGEFLKFILITLAILFINFVKYILYRALGITIEHDDATKEILYNATSYYRALGMVLLPLAILLSFPQLNHTTGLLIFGISIAFVTYLLIILRAIRILKPTSTSIFYLILYLCTLEILPVIYVYKFVIDLA